MAKQIPYACGQCGRANFACMRAGTHLEGLHADHLRQHCGRSTPVLKLPGDRPAGVCDCVLAPPPDTAVEFLLPAKLSFWPTPWVQITHIAGSAQEHTQQPHTPSTSLTVQTVKSYSRWCSTDAPHDAPACQILADHSCRCIQHEGGFEGGICCRAVSTALQATSPPAAAALAMPG